MQVDDLNITDKDIIEKILHGETDVYSSVIERTEAIIARIVWTMIPAEENRRSITHEIYLKAYNDLPTFKFVTKLSTWLAKIAYDACLIFLDRKGMLFDGLAINKVIDDPLQRRDVSKYSDTETKNNTKDSESTFRHEMDCLPPVYRVLIGLFHYEGLNYNEIGQVVNLPDSVVKNYIFKARKLLKNNLLLT